MGGKFLELLKEIAPNLTRVAVIRDTTIPSGAAQFGVIQAAAPSFRMEVTPINMPNAGEIEQSVNTFARAPNGGLIVTASALTLRYRNLIISLAARHKLFGRAREETGRIPVRPIPWDIKCVCKIRIA
jgi:putative ABC transport system substrate-binding protein